MSDDQVREDATDRDAMAPEEPTKRRKPASRRLARLGSHVRADRYGRDKKRTKELFRRYQEEGDLEAREELIMNYMNYARFIASKQRDKNLPMNDIQQAAILGLVEAIDRYDPSHGTEFTTFAYPTIDGEIKHFFRDFGWDVRPPRNLQENSAKVRRASDELTSELNRFPTIEEVADRLGLSVDDVLEAMEASGAYSSVSLESSVSDGDDEAPSILDTYPVKDTELALADDRIVLKQVISEFSEREQEVLRMRFEEGLKQVEIAERLGISQVQVSRLLRRMITKARESFEGGSND